ncbi:glycosyltransferase [Methylobacterium ajmalii]|uniref:rhamnosyltransferase WsaF family glycosyltransferase n=1 Tax=Methylobacterium ajmalii TaxID=2738439 RepID=UPI00190AEAF2|nr:glycosyltransferase [Methylobacterium ajmalii]MBK3398719.1 glycosyltransferase [Methylobacterium ajmalii]MBK3409449.1 glycosyltransferase [Methylobacterium ajmalii]MBK3424200.1 glycosyltransferase [Methylobacterium ajmalii]MBZ6412780.1 glycosyltransferase [Methylobacterium sp.]
MAREELVPLRPRYRRHDPRSLNIHWIVPSFGSPGAGGHMSIFRMVRFLETFGHRQTIWLQNAVHFRDQAHAKSRIREWYQPIGDRVNVLFLPDDTRQLSGDVLIATDCWTAFPAATAAAFQERFYFVQDYEPAFYPAGEIQQIAELTYDFGFSCLAAGRWLQQLMEERGIWARAWDLAVDHDIYFPRPNIAAPSQAIKIAFYARGYTPRRAVRLGIAALNDLAQRLPGIEVHLFGQDDLDVSEIQFPFVNHGILSSEGLSDLYRCSDIGIVFSATNYSLVPLEMMACGLPLVELDVPSTRAVFSGDEVSLAKPVPSAIAACIEALAKDPAKRAAQVAAGLTYVSGLSWETSARRVESALLERLEQVGSRPIDAGTVLARAPALVNRRKASIVIPSYNAGEAFGPVLDMLARQSCDFAYDVLVVDSGSRDQTCDLVRRYADRGIRLETIPNSEFQHGRTRNYAISQTEGEYVAVLTQDARPKDEHWLANLIGGFAMGPRVAGVIGRHEAYPEHDPFTRRDMKEHFDQLALISPVVDLDIGLPSWIHPGSVAWWATLMFYSDNNSAMARAVWQEIPYPEVEWGEDQVWAFEMLKLGFQKAYVDSAVVYHSHDFPTERQFSVSATEGAFWAEEFGLSLHPDEVGAITGMKHRDESYAMSRGISREALTRRLAQNNATVRGRQAGHAAKTTTRR